VKRRHILALSVLFAVGLGGGIAYALGAPSTVTVTTTAQEPGIVVELAGWIRGRPPRLPAGTAARVRACDGTPLASFSRRRSG